MPATLGAPGSAIHDEILKAARAREVAYWELLRAVARGDEVDPDRAAKLIQAAGKTGADYTRDLDVVLKRFDLMSRLPQAQADRARAQNLDAELAAMEREMRERVQAHNAEHARRRLEIAMIEGVANGVLSDVQKMAGNCPYPWLQAAYKELVAGRAEAVRERAALAGRIREHELRIENRDRGRPDDPSRGLVTASAERAEQQLSYWRPILGEVERRIAELDARMRSLEAEMARP